MVRGEWETGVVGRADRLGQLTVGELQHLLMGLLMAKNRGLSHSPIIDRLIDEVSQSLDFAIQREEALEDE